LIFAFLTVLSCAMVATQTTPAPCTLNKCISSTGSCVPTSIGHCSNTGGLCSAATNCNKQVQHASGVTCTNGVCSYTGSCLAGFADCDAVTSNGCETSTRIISTLTAPFAFSSTKNFNDAVLISLGQVFTTPCSGVSALRKFTYYVREPVSLKFKLELYQFTITGTSGGAPVGIVVGPALFSGHVVHTQTEPPAGHSAPVSMAPSTPIPVTPSTTYIAIITLEGANDPTTARGVILVDAQAAGPVAFQSNNGHPNEITSAEWILNPNFSAVFTAIFS